MIRNLNSLFHLLKAFRRDEAGAVAMLYGPMSLMLLLAAGVAIDYSRAYLVKREISRALDAAVLAAGSLASTDQTKMKEIAGKYFDANISPATKTEFDPKILLNFGNDEITATSSANVQTYLMKLAGHDNVYVDARSVAARTLVNVEVALVLDNTGSMYGSKLSSLKTAAKTLVDTLYEPEGSENFVKFALVPFTGSVNVGTKHLTANWIDKAGKSVAAQEDYGKSYEYWDQNKYTGMSAVEAMAHFSADWLGCLRARVGTGSDGEGGTVALDLWDVPADPTDVNTQWAPMVKPVHEYEDDDGDKPSDWKLRNRMEYSGSCPSVEVLPLTNEKATIKSQIDAMVASGGTSVPIGLIWGWRVLSPELPYTEGKNYEEENLRKVIVVLTDGRNDHGYYYSDKTRGYYSAYGMPAYGHLGTGWLGNKLDDKLESICENAKSKNILIYSITFKVSDNNIKSLMRDCATKNDMYFNSPDGSSLQDAFDEIASGLQRLQLTR